MSAEWKFDGGVAEVFDTHVRDHVPMYEEIHRFITEMAAWFVDENANLYDIGASTGEIISNISAAYPDKFSKYIGIDTSSEMCEIASERFREDSSVTIHNMDVLSDAVEMVNANLITSVLTLMFVPINKRQNVVDKAYQAQNKGGALIVVEKVSGNNAKFNEIWTEIYHESKLRNGISPEGVFKKSRAIRGVLKPISTDENLTLLKSAGFSDIDVFLKWGNFVGFIAIK